MLQSSLNKQDVLIKRMSLNQKVRELAYHQLLHLCVALRKQCLQAAVGQMQTQKLEQQQRQEETQTRMEGYEAVWKTICSDPAGVTDRRTYDGQRNDLDEYVFT